MASCAPDDTERYTARKQTTVRRILRIGMQRNLSVSSAYLTEATETSPMDHDARGFPRLHLLLFTSNYLFLHQSAQSAFTSDYHHTVIATRLTGGEYGETYWRGKQKSWWGDESNVRSIKITTRYKGKATPLQAWTGPVGSTMLNAPNFKTIGT
jgi:hypothetical protein